MLLGEGSVGIESQVKLMFRQVIQSSGSFQLKESDRAGPLVIYHKIQSGHAFTKCGSFHCSALPYFLSPIRGNTLLIYEVVRGHLHDPTTEEN